MNQHDNRLWEESTRVWHGVVGVPGNRNRTVLIATAATIVAIVIGIVWGLTGTGANPSDDNLLARAGAPKGDDSGAAPGPSEPANDNGPPGAGGGAGSGGAGSAGGGSGGGSGGVGPAPAANRAPVIENLGVSSDGLTLTVAPTVTDPDGDSVTIQIEVDGRPADTDEAGTARVTFDPDDGYRRDVTGRIIATDPSGAATEQSFAESLAAVTRMELSAVEFQVLDTKQCFQTNAAQRLTGSLQFYGALRQTFSINEELRADRTRVVLSPAQTAEVVGKPPELRVLLLSGSLGDGRDVYSDVHTEYSTSVRHRFFTASSCNSVLSYRVNFTTR